MKDKHIHKKAQRYEKEDQKEKQKSKDDMGKF